MTVEGGPTLFGYDLSERDFQRQVIVPALEQFGYMVNHVYRLQTRDGQWRTSTTLRGLPDLMAVGRGCTLWIEIKGPRTPVGADQVLVLERLAEIETNRCWILRPMDDWQAIANWIARPETAPRTFGWDETTLEKAARTKHRETRAR